MGSAAMVGLGLAHAQCDRRVIVVTGDGEMLMGLGALATIATARPKNLAILVLDNELYGETGNQATHTSGNVDLVKIAEGAGFVSTTTATTTDEGRALCDLIRDGEGPVFAVAKVKPDRPDAVIPPRDGTYLKLRFRAAVLGQANAEP